MTLGLPFPFTGAVCAAFEQPFCPWPWPASGPSPHGARRGASRPLPGRRARAPSLGAHGGHDPPRTGKARGPRSQHGPGRGPGLWGAPTKPARDPRGRTVRRTSAPPPPPAVSPADLRPDAAGRGLRRGRLPGGGRGAGRGLPRGPHRSLVHPSPQAAHFPHLARGDPQPAGSRGHTRHKPPEVGPACWGPGGNRSPAAGIRSSPRARRAGHRKGGTEPQKGAAAAGGAGPRGPASDPARLPGAGAANCRNLCSLDNWGVMDTALGGFTLVEIHNKLGFASACQRCPGVAGRLAAGGTSETSGQDLQGRLYRSAPGRNPETSSQAQYPNSVNGPAITTCAVARVGV